MNAPYGTVSIPELIARHARSRPDAVAVESGGQELTFGALIASAGAVAATLVDSGVQPGSVVAVNGARRLETPVAILGTLMAGCTYLPVDSTDPASSRSDVIELAEPVMLLTSTGETANAFGLPSLTVDITQSAVAAPELAGHGDDIAYLMPTSGTMGRQKVARVSHGNVCANISALQESLGGVTDDDVYLHFASFSFSSSVRQLFLPLSGGARVVLASGQQRRDPLALLNVAADRGVTVVDVIPSLLSVLLDTASTSGDASFGSALRMVLTASERLPGRLLQLWYDYARELPAEQSVRVFNMYGQTETAGIVCLHEASPSDTSHAVVPIGVALPGLDVGLITDDGSAPEDGSIGEVVVSGPTVAHGYLTRSEHARSGFARSPHDALARYRTGDLGSRDENGVLHFHARSDSQVKIRGEQVDLAQVERVLAEHPAVADAIAVDVIGPDGQAELRASVRCRTGYVSELSVRKAKVLPTGIRVVELNPPETDFMYEEIFEHQVYLRHGISLPDNAIVIDAGANIGLFSLFVATHHPDASVYAIEPAAPVAAALRTNIALNGFTRLTVRETALSDRSGTGIIKFYPHSVGMSSLHANEREESAALAAVIANQARRGRPDYDGKLHNLTDELIDAKLVAEDLPCTTTRLSDLMTTEGIGTVDLLKIDVQKSELDLINGIDEHHWNSIKQIVAEVHDIGDRVKTMADMLTFRGYDVRIEQDIMFSGSKLFYIYAARTAMQAAMKTSAAGVTRPEASAATQSAAGPGAKGVSAAELIRSLAARLPASHVPAEITVEPDFPRTASGKPDRATVVAAMRASRSAVTPSTPADDPYRRTVTDVWVEVLGHDVGPHDDFFEVGGNSLAAARVTTRLRERYGRSIPIRMLFEVSTVALLADRIRELQETSSGSAGGRG